MLNALNIKKEYGIQTVLDIERLEIRDEDRVGLIGRDGAGKSTLLGVLSGRVAYDEGVVKRYCPIAEILQTGETGDEPKARLLGQLELRDGTVKNGGEKTRHAIGAAFSSRAPLLFANEPTASLDMEGVELLEEMTKGYRGAILMIPHGRTLLGRVCNQIWGLSRATVRVFDGNYSDQASQGERERGSQEFEYQQYQKEKRRMERAADALQKGSRKMAKSPEHMGSSEQMPYKGIAAFQQGHVQSNKSPIMSRLEHLDKKGRPDEPPQMSMRLPNAGRIRAENATAIRHLTVNCGNRTVLGDVSLEIEAGKRTFITGNNGAGRSTLVRVLMGRTPEASIVSGARVAYFFQGLDTLGPEKTVLESVAEGAAYPQHICRAVLVNLYMTKDDVFKPVSILSGGEKAKTALAKVLVSGCSFMILGEPTNHMDVYTMEGLEHLLESYDGTLLAVSHDRTFIGHTGDVVCQFEEGSIQKSTAQKTDTQHSEKY